MKKLISVLGLFILLAGCSNSQPDPNTTLYTKGLELINTMDKVAESNEFVSLLTAQGEITDIIYEMGQGDYSTPTGVYKVTGIATPEDYSLDSSDETLKGIYSNKIVSAMPSIINSTLGVNYLAASSAIIQNNTFLCEGAREACVLVYTYSGNYTALVSFVPGDDGTIMASSGFVHSGALLDFSSADAVKNTLVNNGAVADCTVEQITVE